MLTEKINPRYVELDSWSSGEMIAAMYESQLAAAAAVRGALHAIADAVDDAVPALRRGGRIVYVGAGTSGRIGVQAGTELTPTYDWPADRLVFAMAGGLGALVQSAEDADDDDSGRRGVHHARFATLPRYRWRVSVGGSRMPALLPQTPSLRASVGLCRLL